MRYKPRHPLANCEVCVYRSDYYGGYRCLRFPPVYAGKGYAGYTSWEQPKVNKDMYCHEFHGNDQFWSRVKGTVDGSARMMPGSDELIK